MSDFAIQVENLSKLYRLSLNKAKYKTLRDTLALAPRVVANFLNKGSSSNGTSRLPLVGMDSRQDLFWALKDVSFDIKRGEVVGIIGRNGAGKSTLLKILSRITEPTRGCAIIHGRVGSLLEVGTGFHPELSGRENIFLNGAILGMSKADIERRFDDIVIFAEVEKFIDTPVKHYSSGMYLRLAFAVAAHLETEILLVDEVLAVGDMQFQKKCLGKMKDVAGAGRTVLFVSHNMSAVKSLCTKALLLKKGNVEFEGVINEAVDRYLTDGSTMSESGIIDDSFTRQFGNDEGRFRRVETHTLDGTPTKQFYYRQAVVVSVNFEILKTISDANLSIAICTTDGTIILYFETLDIDGQALHLATGIHTVALEIPVFMLPGTYCVHLGLGHLNGRTIDWVERAYDFNVLKVSLEKDKHYRWTSSHGFATMDAKWHLSEEIKA